MLSGKTVQLRAQQKLWGYRATFQSPCYRVKRCNGARQPCSTTFFSVSFQSPCYRVKRCNEEWGKKVAGVFDLSVPLLSGKTVQHDQGADGRFPLRTFQSPCYRVKRCNDWTSAEIAQFRDMLSVPLLSGKTVQHRGFKQGDGLWIDLSVPLLSGKTVQPLQQCGDTGDE